MNLTSWCRWLQGARVTATHVLLKHELLGNNPRLKHADLCLLLLQRDCLRAILREHGGEQAVHDFTHISARAIHQKIVQHAHRIRRQG